jgi:hypothetical protein
MLFNTVEEALTACELAGYQPRSHVTGIGEQTYWVHLPGLERGACYWGDSQFLGWANAHWRLLEIEKIREQAGRDEPNEMDELNGFRLLIDAAIAADIEEQRRK